MTKSSFLSREPVWTDAGFIGRSAALAWLARQLGSEIPQNCNIVGEPRSGKTSLLHAAYRAKIGLPPGLTGVYVWIRLVEWAERGPQAFWTQLRERLDEAARAAGYDIPPPTAPRPDTPWLAYQALTDRLAGLLAEQPPARVIVLIDDFELLIPDITAQGLDWLRALAVRFAQHFALAITSTDPLDQVCRPLGAEPVSPLYNIFIAHHLGLLTEAEADALIQAAARAEGYPPIDPTTASFLRHEAGRHPDLLKLGCDYLFQAWDEEGAAAPDEIIEAVRSDLRYDAHARWLCERLYTRRTPDERAFLLGLVGGAAADDPLLLRRLERKLGLVEMRQGQPTPFADVWRHWIARHRPGAAATEGEGRPASPHLDLHYQPELREIRLGDRTRKLSAVEDRLFRYLAGKPNQVCTTQELLERVWGAGRTPSVVEKTVNRLRDKVEEDPARPRLILSVRGEGYMLRAVAED